MKNIKNDTALFLNALAHSKNTVQKKSGVAFSIIMVLFFFSTFLVSSCEDVLTVEPYSTITPETFLDSEPSAELALAGVYNVLNAGSINGSGNASSFRRGMLHMLNGGTDEAVGVREISDYVPYYSYTYSPTDNFGRDAWLFMYAGITRANFLLESIDGITFDNPQRKDQIKAEARFLRAVYYQYLAWMYGGVPLKLSVEDDRIADIERSSLEQVYAVIESDLKFAYENLNETSSRSGAANKWSAAGYLSKMYTYLASCKENNVGSSLDLALNHFDWVDSVEMYRKAYEVNSSIIGKKTLSPDYFHLFRTEKRGANYGEVLFGVEAADNQDVIMIYVEAFIPQGNVGVTGGGYGYMRPGMDLYNKYDRVNDNRFKNNLTANLGGNAGALQTEVLDGTTYYVPLNLPATLSATYPNLCIGKWRYPKPGTKTIATWASDCNFQLIRYADILLLQAELEFKHKKDVTAARNYLKQVRERAAGNNQTKLNALTTKYFNADFMKELMDERSRELCFETWRRIDLIRTGTLQSTFDTVLLTGHATQNRMSIPKSNLKPYHIWFPIPINEFLNKKMVQNTGYNAN